jgi:hypothetical protein
MTELRLRSVKVYRAPSVEQTFPPGCQEFTIASFTATTSAEKGEGSHNLSLWL